MLRLHRGLGLVILLGTQLVILLWQAVAAGGQELQAFQTVVVAGRVVC
jgi:hypothetical protein